MSRPRPDSPVMRTLIGIDPGLAATGWGVVRFDGSRFFHVAHGVVRTEAEFPLSERLLIIHNALRKLLAKYGPTEAGVEELFFARNASSAMQVAHARGVVLLALGQRGIPVECYSPPAREAGGDWPREGGQSPGAALGERGSRVGGNPFPGSRR